MDCFFQVTTFLLLIGLIIILINNIKIKKKKTNNNVKYQINHFNNNIEIDCVNKKLSPKVHEWEKNIKNVIYDFGHLKNPRKINNFKPKNYITNDCHNDLSCLI